MTARITFLFRLQATLFFLFYFVLVLLSRVYFERRMEFIEDALGSDFVGPGVLRFCIFMHSPLVQVLVTLVPLVLLVAVWYSRPGVGLIVGQAVFMVVIVLVAFVPPVAAEVTTSAILDQIYEAAIEHGLVEPDDTGQSPQTSFNRSWPSGSNANSSALTKG